MEGWAKLLTEIRKFRVRNNLTYDELANELESMCEFYLKQSKVDNELNEKDKRLIDKLVK